MRSRRSLPVKKKKMHGSIVNSEIAVERPTHLHEIRGFASQGRSLGARPVLPLSMCMPMGRSSTLSRVITILKGEEGQWGFI